MPLIDRIGERVRKLAESIKNIEARLTDLEVKAISTVGVAIHRDNPHYTRPQNFEIVIWLGNVMPENGHDDDIWIPYGS